MIELPIRYKTDRDRVQACHEREKARTWMEEHIQEIVDLHQKLKKDNSNHPDAKLLDIILHTVIADVFHTQAEQEYCLRMFGVVDA